ncbi:MAG: family 10 glycosylhydrolase [Deltaproteobacteria bacterium]|nr:family 10 glycosylhydrolase [Deltaproteobacteria bacterium]
MRHCKMKLLALILCVSLSGCASRTADRPAPAIANNDEIFNSFSIAEYGYDEPLTAHESISAGEKEEEIPPLPVYKLKKEERTIAVQVLLIDCNNLEELDDRLKTLRESGVNTLIFRVFHNKGDRFYSFADPKNDRGVYFKSKHAPLVDDILADVARISHKNGIKIFAWMTTRYADYGVEHKREWQAAAYDLKGGGYVRARGLNLFNRDVKNHLINLYRDLAAYNVDGILFQDDLVLRHSEGFSRDARLAFARESGLMPDPNLLYREVIESRSGKMMVTAYGDLFWEWSRWKNRRLMRLASEIMTESKKVNSNIKFALNLMYEAALKPKEALAWLSQDLNEAVKTGFDYYAIMAYHLQMGEELGLEGSNLYSVVAQLVENALKKVNDPEKIMIKLQIADWKSKKRVSHDEINKIVKIVREKGNTSLAFVPYYGKFDFRKIMPAINSPSTLALQAKF